MSDTVLEEMTSWVQELEGDAIRLGDEKLAQDICELSYYMTALKNGISPKEDSEVASEILRHDYPSDLKTWNRWSEFVITMTRNTNKLNELLNELKKPIKV